MYLKEVDIGSIIAMKTYSIIPLFLHLYGYVSV